MNIFNPYHTWFFPGLFLAFTLLVGCGEALKDTGIPTVQLERGDLYITLVENGETRAAHGEQIASPRVRGSLKIVHLWPEGEKVKAGDLILQFDPTEFEKRMVDVEGELIQAQADLAKIEATQSQRLAEKRSNIEDRKAAYRLAELNLGKTQYGTPLEQEQAKLKLEQARLARDQTEGNLRAQILADKVELKKSKLRIDKRQQRYDKAKRDFAALMIYAQKPGIVVHERIWKGSKEEKVRVGDELRHGGMILVQLPDLSTMQVIAKVGEMDAHQVRPGQEVRITLEAFPGPVFNGKVAKVAPIASTDHKAANIKTFELFIDIISSGDERLKPGMSAAAEIIVEKIPDMLIAPRQALFKRGQDTVVYRRKGRSFVPINVAVLAQNATQAGLDSTLSAGDEIALKDPTQER